ncbi:hypothetical protein [Enemella sp. A6]|uniref:hypothetical protein n=1 Tax=Enemella sp. A6 TaxID=3440152 RepID=UPI003EBC681A
MTEQPEFPEAPEDVDHTYGENIADLDLTDEQERNAKLYLEDPEAVDDVPWSPPERRPLGAQFTDEHGESIEQRLRQEEPEDGTAYGAPSRGGEADDQPGGRRVMIGGDDPDAIPADEDWLGHPE